MGATRFSSSEIEAIAITVFCDGKGVLGRRFALRTWKYYAQGANLQVVTDHQALVWLEDHSLLCRRFARWVQGIQSSPFTIFHSPDEDLVVADALRRDI